MSLNFDTTLSIQNMYKATFGLEKESLRSDENGFLSHTKHPFIGNSHIDRDFCENQVEIVTDVWDSTDAVFKQISELHRTVVNELSVLESGKEIVWQFSNPPYVKGESDIPIASYKRSLKGKEIYRKYLAEKYGKKKMLFSGIHFNFSFGDELIEISRAENKTDSFYEHKNNLYLELAKKITKYSWLIVYLTAASPVMDGSYFDDTKLGKDVITPFSSARCSEIGYWNEFIPILKYDTLESYVGSIQDYVDKGLLRSVSELYYPIRLKPKGENSLDNLKNSGVNHIELRMLDLNPLSPVGIFKEDIDFLHMLIIYLMSLDDEDFTEHEQVSAVKNVKHAANFDDENTVIEFYGEKVSVKSAALKVLCDMQDFFAKRKQETATEIIIMQKEKILHKNKRYAQIIKDTYGKDYVKKGIQLSLTYADILKKEPL